MKNSKMLIKELAEFKEKFNLNFLMFVDERYAHAADMVTIQQTQEQALILIQQELTDDKRWRIVSGAKKEDRVLTPDEEHEVEKLEKRELRLEKRYEVLEEQLLMK